MCAGLEMLHQVFTLTLIAMELTRRQQEYLTTARSSRLKHTLREKVSG